MSATMPSKFQHMATQHPALDWERVGRIGMIMLSVDRATDVEIGRMLPSEVACMHVNRVAMGPHCTVQALRDLEADLTRAASNLLPGTPLDAIGFSCTSGAVAIGPDRVRACIQEAHPGVPVTTPLAAAMLAMRHLRASRVAVLTPYIDEVNAIIDNALGAEGFDVVTCGGFHRETDAEMSAIAPASLRAALLELDSSEADVLFICCTALHASSVIAEVEATTGKPVITSHQAMLWHALALAGIDTPIHGFGQLLAQPGRADVS